MRNKFHPVSLGYVIWDEKEKQATDWFQNIRDARWFLAEGTIEGCSIIECFTHPAGAVIAPKE